MLLHQHQHLTLFLTGQNESDNWLAKGSKYDFYHLKSYVDNLLIASGCIIRRAL
jgi:phenylalanyl-tRNA synthetase beta subunit